LLEVRAGITIAAIANELYDHVSSPCVFWYDGKNRKVNSTLDRFLSNTAITALSKDAARETHRHSRRDCESGVDAWIFPDRRQRLGLSALRQSRVKTG
jgi:hypothetical protein